MTRPKTFDHFLSFRIPAQLDRDFRSHCVRSEVAVSDLLRSLVVEHLDAQTHRCDRQKGARGC